MASLIQTASGLKKMSNIFVISDTHLNHTNIIKYCNRPFENADLMNECIIDNWNSVVKPQDKVYHLGDVYMGGDRANVQKMLKSLNGHKRLILGNHDNGQDQILQRSFEKINMWRMFPEFGLLLTHVPVHESSLYRGPKSSEDSPTQLLNVHGHIHNRPSPEGPYKNVSVEMTNYVPVNIEELRIK